MLAKDIMTREVTTVKPDLSVQELAKVFAQGKISGAPVVADNGRVTGVVSDGDIFKQKRGAGQFIDEQAAHLRKR